LSGVRRPSRSARLAALVALVCCATVPGISAAADRSATLEHYRRQIQQSLEQTM